MVVRTRGNYAGEATISFDVGKLPIWYAQSSTNDLSIDTESEIGEVVDLDCLSSARLTAASFAKCWRLVDAGPQGPKQWCGGAASEDAHSRWRPRVLRKQ